MRCRAPFASLLAAALLCATSGSAEARRLERLVMPGPVIGGHAKYEDECEKCHAPLSDVTQRSLCLDCHDRVAEDLQGRTGFHGRSPAVGRRECRECHTEHAGRDADIVLLDAHTFDHGLADFALRGVHRKVACRDCHAADKPFRDAPTRCIGCHEDDDPHRGRLGSQCGDCHGAKGWSAVDFDHGTTDFALHGRHREVACAACHVDQQWKGLPHACSDCHRGDDVHRGRFGDRCDDCHREEGWDREVRFDHDATKFPLRGRHAKIACIACHLPSHPKAAIDTRCVSCHRDDDAHAGRNGERCDGCHGERRWSKATFDHGKTKFPLRGRHARIACQACHVEDAQRVRLERECLACHRNHDVHRGAMGSRCERCHRESGWKEVRFDHDRDTDFRLLGAHRDTPCEGCHQEDAYHSDTPSDCYACHRGDDVHDGSQGRDCARCHDNDQWAGRVRFDHDVTHFPLIGLHAAVPCEDCHGSGEMGRVDGRCVACHREDDAHQARLGLACAHCHTPNGWRLWVFDHDRETDFPLEGRHAAVDCLGCHREPLDQAHELPRRCYACHRGDDVHQGGFGRRCERCHTAEGFDVLEIR